MNKTVLIADDARLIRRICSAILRQNGYRVVEAEDGREALDRYQEHHPDVVLLDLRMPSMDGLAALKAIKEVDPDACVVIVTGGSAVEVEDALRSGAQGLVLKPFSRARILTAVRTALAMPAPRLGAPAAWVTALAF